MTDVQRLPDPTDAARALPKGAAIILRHTDARARAELAERLEAIARQCGLRLLIAGDAALAARIGCAGLHLPETRAPEAAHWKAVHPSWLITGAAHSLRGIGIGARAGCDAILLAPVFATQSHSGGEGYGAARFRLAAQHAPVPVYALGGINAQTIRRLAGARLAGVAAIEALTPDHSA
jgi:thiamine-phosphate pyrophosphorylase